MIHIITIGGDREEYMRGQLESSGEEYKIWPAIDNRKGNLKTHNMQAGAIGCYLSHFMLWQALDKLGKDEYYYIVEDDAAIDFEKLREFRKLLEVEKFKYDLNWVWLGGIDYKPAHASPFERCEKFYTPGEFLQTIGYVVKATFLPQIITALKANFCGYNIDNELYWRVFSQKNKGYEHCLALYEQVVVGAGFHSTIN